MNLLWWNQQDESEELPGARSLARRTFRSSTGRTTSVTSSAGTTTLTYDFEGRATSIVGPGISQFNAFNGLDTRVGSTTNSVTRSFLRDGAYVTDPVLSDGAAFYTPGVSERRGGVTTFLHSGLKNADAQSTASGLSGARQYDAFGNLLSSSGAWQGPFGYAGAFGYQEDATGLMLLGHRLYDPSTGRFLTRDPIQDGRNWYVYCANDPVAFVDPDGQIRVAIVLAIIAACVAVWQYFHGDSPGDAIIGGGGQALGPFVPPPFGEVSAGLEMVPDVTRIGLTKEAERKFAQCLADDPLGEGPNPHRNFDQEGDTTGSYYLKRSMISR